MTSKVKQGIESSLCVSTTFPCFPDSTLSEAKEKSSGVIKEHPLNLAIRRLLGPLVISRLASYVSNFISRIEISDHKVSCPNITLY